mmetsp:Transcript_74097/g.131011  ORF Transcript_74097/g.131011 Transcript_74097/m.131011 type:complete len:1474 (-) Transcript_74097:92-4513(-)|eukprot:CAMPEP_0197665460 /NCGR_PEP_ID=MMETSP1338-20131121/59237_1 /TAXON_ID=43686 ORGANISM="Pelagodinium beii, Strain RCC1491" /NCGR_SAMPLE_ID=MMETSP1338 /ASSEMBLY_ACC=CAM_ASM_000754 /LENGTH=1473 /DNA_ID=CAMNT_0043244265 /DNA_START=80 /DNA_END=4501 /DNA_ORIENTATION=+
MPSGIDAALKSLKVDDMKMPPKVSYDGFAPEKKKKPEVSVCTIDPAAEGLEKCQKIVKEQEFKIRKLKEKMAGIAPTKKNKPEINKVKEDIELLQADGNYRAANTYVRGVEEAERDKRREEQEREAEGGVELKKKGEPAPKAASSASKKTEAAAAEESAGSFETDAEVVGVIKSAVDGSDPAVAQLEKGAGAGPYKSEVKAEVASMAAVAGELISAKIKRVPTREFALRTARALRWNPPAYLPALPAVLLLLDEAKVKGEPLGSALDLCQVLSHASSRGSAVPEMVLPVLLAHIGAAAAGKWKVKVSVMGLVMGVLKRMAAPSGCPRQLGLWMPKVMSAVRDAVGDARKEVKKEAENFLTSLGTELAGTPEIKNMTADIVNSIIDSANMDKARETLNRMANTTFLNTVDSASFALLFPVVSRAMREQSHEAKMKGVQILGASVNLIADPLLLQPYLEELLPLLKECLLHPTATVQHEAGKAFGCLASGLPEVCDSELMPYLLEKLQSAETNDDVSEVERRGAARGLALVLIARRDLLPSCLHETVMQRIKSGSTNEMRAGGLQLVQALASQGPQAFLPHLKSCMQTVLDALTETSEIVHKQAIAAVRVLIDEFGATAPHLLLPRMQESLFFDDEDSRGRAMDLFFALCEKISEGMKFGQDFLSMDCLSVWHRHTLLASMFIARTDRQHDVRRMATLLWKEKLQSGPKAKAEILPVLLQILKALKESGKSARVESADLCLADLTSDEKANFESVKAMAGASGVLFAQAAADVETVEGEVREADFAAPKPLRSTLLKSRVQEALSEMTFAAPLRAYLSVVIVSCCMESRKRTDAEEALEEELRPLAEAKALQASGSAIETFGLKAMLDKVFEGVEDEAERDQRQRDPDELVHVEGLRMMYGGGHMLLKDATLDLRRGHRYGVVGRNGAGKTTLMSMVAAGSVSGMSKDVKTLHVKPEVLVEVSELNALQFCARDIPDVDETAMQDALKEVGFPVEMQQKAVTELSGGWRMKLLLASAMMRECDILLLDEPTNHLDRPSVEWLSSYLRSLTKTSLMVISHDPEFLNKVCTDIIQYSTQRTLDYYDGNFDDFRKARNISSDLEAEDLLLGRATFEDEKNDEDEKEVGKASGGITAGILDKTSKISFPIPGSLKGHSSAKPVMELKNVSFAYDEQEGPLILRDISCKISLTSRVGIVGANGAGKSTLLNLLCGELMPTPAKEGATPGEVFKHRNLRLAYIAQQHMYHLSEFLNSTPYVYIQRRYQNGWDEALQRRLIDPVNEEEANMRKELAKKFGKYGYEVENIVSRVVRGNELFYEVQWKGLDDPKQNTVEPVSKLKKLGVAGYAKAFDERNAAQAAGIDTRPLSSREIVKHLEQFGLDEDMVMNREIGGFSAGQKSKLTLGAAFWTKPHIVALDEPTNYIDMETLDALVQGLARFKGGIIVISHASEFVNQVCSEIWKVEAGHIADKIKQDLVKK